jgi:hypothetical protein
MVASDVYSSSNANNHNDESGYNEITEIMKKLSNRTLEIKTSNIKLLNSINSEVTNLMVKADQLAKICLKSRNGLIDLFLFIYKFFLI